jgi:hypothetical protein
LASPWCGEAEVGSGLGCGTAGFLHPQLKLLIYRREPLDTDTTPSLEGGDRLTHNLFAPAAHDARVDQRL